MSKEYKVPRFQIISGPYRLTRDPELKTVGQNNTKLCKLGLAITTGYGEKESSMFYEANAWGNLAEHAHKDLGKGDPLALSGALSQDTWKDNSGGVRTTLVINVHELNGVTWNGERGGAGEGNTSVGAPRPQVNEYEPEPSGDLPF